MLSGRKDRARWCKYNCQGTVPYVLTSDGNAIFNRVFYLRLSLGCKVT